MYEQRVLGAELRAVLIGFVASFGHAATEIIQKLFVFTDALDVD